ncbi:thiolase family protein [Nocardioides hungaricus]
MLRDVAIVGVYTTELGRDLRGRTSFSLTMEAVKGAVADAGLSLSDIDGAAVVWPGRSGAPLDGSANWAPYLNGRLRWTMDADLDTAGIRGLLKAAAAVGAGLCESAVVAAGLAGSWSPDGNPVPEGSAVGTGLDLEFSDPYGQWVMPHFALVAQRHMHEFGTTPEQLARVASSIRNNGHVNPEAIMYGRGPYTVEDVLASRMIASPLHLLDCCIVGQGGFGMVVTTAERAADLRQKPVRVLGGGMEFLRGAYADPPLLSEVQALGTEAVTKCLEISDATVDDLDVALLYDATSFEVIRQLEMLGACGPGEGGPLVETGFIDLDGALPVNPDGGILAHSWAPPGHLSQRIIEGVRQLRGTAVNQVPGADLALAVNAGSGAQHIEMALLGA